MNRDEIANVLKSNGKITIPMSEVHDIINTMASEIYAQKRDQRSFEKVYEDCSNIVIEFALAKSLNGQRNPHTFNMNLPITFCWDVEACEKLFEVKRHKVGTKWFSYPENKIQTFKKYKHNVDYLITAYMDTNNADQCYEVEFALITEARSFFDYYQQSKYKNALPYYNHPVALKNNQCTIINLREPGNW